MTPHFCGVSAYIGLFELSRTIVSGHYGQTGVSLDVGATLAGSSGENVGLMSGPSHIWFVIYFTPDFTAGHTSDPTADLARLRRGDEAWETGGRGGQRQPHTSLTDTCSTADFA